MALQKRRVAAAVHRQPDRDERDVRSSLRKSSSSREPTATSMAAVREVERKLKTLLEVESPGLEIASRSSHRCRPPNVSGTRLRNGFDSLFGGLTVSRFRMRPMPSRRSADDRALGRRSDASARQEHRRLALRASLCAIVRRRHARTGRRASRSRSTCSSSPVPAAVQKPSRRSRRGGANYYATLHPHCNCCSDAFRRSTRSDAARAARSPPPRATVAASPSPAALLPYALAHAGPEKRSPFLIPESSRRVSHPTVRSVAHRRPHGCLRVSLTSPSSIEARNPPDASLESIVPTRFKRAVRNVRQTMARNSH